MNTQSHFPTGCETTHTTRGCAHTIGIAGLAGLIGILIACFTLTASAQWHWIDERGVKVFSDLPPPLTIPGKNILRRPPEFDNGNAAIGTLLPVAPAKPVSAPAAGEMSKSINSAASLKAAEDARMAEQKAFEEKNNKIKAENCTRAKQSMAVISSGTRIQSADAQGQITVFGDKERAEETARLQGMIASNC